MGVPRTIRRKRKAMTSLVRKEALGSAKLVKDLAPVGPVVRLKNDAKRDPVADGDDFIPFNVVPLKHEKHEFERIHALKDVKLCVDCSSEFHDTVAEQQFRLNKGFDGAPKRCKDCRRAKKQRIEDG